MNKNVLVTRVDTEIGRYIAEKFLKEGFDLYGTYLEMNIVQKNLKNYMGMRGLS